MTIETIEKYENLKTIEEEMKFFTKSEIRLKILTCLNKYPYSIKEIVNSTGLTYSSVSSNIGKLQNKGHVYKENNKFKIQPVSKIYLKNVLEFNKAIQIISNFDKFWNKHNINFINKSLLKNITELYNSKIVESTSIDIYKTHNIIKERLMSSKNVKAIFPYLHPDYPLIIENLIFKNSKAELTVNKDIYQELFNGIDKKNMEKLIKNKKIKIYTTKIPIGLYLIVDEDYMGLGLFKTDGSFDQNRILLSENKNAIKWGEKLFKNIKEQYTK